MKSFKSTASIRATPESIWALITDAGGFPAWNTTLTRVDGKIAKGEKVVVFAKISPDRPFPVTVEEFEPGKKMVWANRLPLGLFQGVRTYTLTDKGDGTTDFSMEEIFSGPLSPLFGKLIPDLQPSFEVWASDLKKRAEAGK